METKPTVRQVYALAAALCERAGEEFPESRAEASELIERLRIEIGHPAPRLADVAIRPRRRRRRGPGAVLGTSSGGRARSRPSSRARCAEGGRQSGWNGAAPREDVLERGLEPDGDRARQHGGLAERRDLDARRERQPVREQARNRLEQQVAVRADARRRGRRARRRRRRRSARRAARSAARSPPRPRCAPRSPLRAAPNTARGSRGQAGEARRPAPTPRAPTGRASRRARRGRSRSRRRPRGARGAARRRSTSPAPIPVPTERNTKSSTPRATPCHCSPSAARLMSFSSVTGRSRRCSSSLANDRPSSPATFSARLSDAVVPDDARDADDDAVEERGVERRRLEERAPQAGRSRRSRLPRRRTVSSTSCRARIVPARSQTAPRSEARAQVEAEHQRRLGHRLEVDGAVAGPVGAVLGLADEPRLEQRLERERDRRLRDARAPGDLGARDRRAGADGLEHRRAR